MIKIILGITIMLPAIILCSFVGVVAFTGGNYEGLAWASFFSIVVCCFTVFAVLDSSYL